MNMFATCAFRDFFASGDRAIDSTIAKAHIKNLPKWGFKSKTKGTKFKGGH